MSQHPKPKSGIDQIKLYTPGEAPKVKGALRKLSSNENLYGPSPKAIAAIAEAAAEVWRYPNVDHSELRASIGEVHDLPAAQIICGVGSDEILYLLAQAYAGEGDEIIMTQYGFEVYGIVTHAVGAELVVAEETERRVDVDQVLKAVTPKTRLIYIANPANPTGTILPDEELERLASSLPSDVILVIDSAYAEFAEGYDGGAGLARSMPNVVMTRTFSKLYGLGGLRIGWGFGAQDVIDTLNRIRQPFNLSNVALAGAQAAMEDQNHVQICRENILEDRKYLTDALRQLGLQIDESSTNFILVRFADEATATRARAFLAERGFLVRSVSHYGFPEALRITIGTKDDNRAVAALLSEFMVGAL